MTTKASANILSVSRIISRFVANKSAMAIIGHANIPSFQYSDTGMYIAYY